MGHGGHGKDGKVRKNTEGIRGVRETCTEPVEVSVSKDFDNFLSRIDVKLSELRTTRPKDDGWFFVA